MRNGASQACGPSRSLWMAMNDTPVFAPLTADAHARTCVIGAGIAGLTTAWRLARTGHDVIVLEEHDLHGGQTARTTGHLCDALDDRYFELEHLHGERGAHLAAHSHGIAIDTIEHICEEEGIDCAFARVDGYLVRGEGDPHADVLQREYEAARRAGLNVELLDSAPGGLERFGPALRFPRQARFDALAYTTGLARAIVRMGGRIHTHSHVVHVDGGGNAGATTDSGARVQCENVVVAANVPFNDRVTIHTKQAAYRTYVVALRLDPGSLPDALLWDTLDPYHYVRIAPARNGTWLLVGGEDRKTGQDDSTLVHYEVLESWARSHFPMALDVGYRWSGQVIEPIDGLGFLGHNPGLADNVYVATGDSGNGLTHGTLAGLIVADLIVDGDSPWRALYAPNRRTLRAADAFVRETLNFMPYYSDWVSAGEIEGLDQLPAGEGAVLRRGLHKIAAFRDEDNALHLHSAKCPHLGCVVHWNDAERSWDCPCHGSRFDARDGSCLNGPAAHGLAPLEAPAPSAVPTSRPAIRM
ncbi:FAD-dependent oxidoreductase [Lysobacter sp. HX-5-24]|uniref:FAD-dependent oxidoreductase n=2 Tax=Noviluteimonas gilva TaxID=2682097 RepID=A0A7C9LHG3_9GAMM|nr:FAD-dependent oxidoreductase [Lysobacter gilvus]